MEIKKLQMLTIALLAMWIVFIPISKAACIDVLLPDELPLKVITQNGTTLDYSYNLEDEEYFISWFRDNSSGGSLGPLQLERSCLPSSVDEENDEFILFGGSCGTFCWSYKIFSLTARMSSTSNQFQSVMRPLAFDSERSLIAYYPSQDLIVIRNLLTRYEQEVPTRYGCYTASGLCFKDFKFINDSLEYTWEPYPQGDDEIIRHQLEEALVER